MTKISNFACAMFMSMILALYPTLSQGTYVKQSGSSLSKDTCLSWLDSYLENDCPDRQSAFEHWKELNDKCCPAGGGLTVHCQMDIDSDGNTFSVIDCLAEQTIQPGVIGRLIMGQNGNLMVDNVTTCPNGMYRSEWVNSSFILYPYCNSKTREDDSKEKVCDGGPVMDDRFVCRLGYEPTTSTEECTGAQGFNSSVSCFCQPKVCLAKQQPFRSVTITKPVPDCGQFVAEGVIVYGCWLAEPTSTSPSGSNSSTSTPFDRDTGSMATVKPKEGGNNDSEVVWLLPVIFVCILVLVVVVIVVVWLIWRYCCTGDYSPQNQNEGNQDNVASVANSKNALLE